MLWDRLRRWFRDELLRAHRAAFLMGVLSFMVLAAMDYPEWGACTGGLFLCCSGVLAMWGAAVLYTRSSCGRGFGPRVPALRSREPHS